MKNIKEFIIEKFRINKENSKKIYPKDLLELRKIIRERLEKDTNADLNDIDTSEITDMENLFVGLTPVEIDISEWDVSKVKSMKGMFNDCRYLKSTGDLGNWNISSLKDTSFMFNNCRILKNIGDLSKWDISNIETMKCMFQRCTSIKTIGDITHWKLPNSNYDVFDISPIKPQPPQRI